MEIVDDMRCTMKGFGLLNEEVLSTCFDSMWKEEEKDNVVRNCCIDLSKITIGCKIDTGLSLFFRHSFGRFLDKSFYKSKVCLCPFMDSKKTFPLFT